MARPLRIEYPGAVYHVTSRGDRREDIYADDADRRQWLDIFGDVCTRYQWRCYAYCLMGNHYHIVIETPQANLSQGMRQLNGLYTQKHNFGHGKVGHVFQGRFKAILVQREAYLLELARYVVLNSVRAGLCASAADWPWSSYRFMLGQTTAPAWLATDALIKQFGSTPARARAAYTQHVHAGTDQPSPWAQLQGQTFLGDAAFAQDAQQRLRLANPLPGTANSGDTATAAHAVSAEIPRAQRLALNPAAPLEYFVALPERNTAIAQAFASGAYTQQQIAQSFGLHYASVSRIVRKQEKML